MSSVDVWVALIYLVAVVAIGVTASFRSGSDKQLYLAGGELSWFPLGISVMVSAFSAVNFVAFPSEIISNGPAVMISLPVFLLVLIPVNRFIIPFFRKQVGISAYSFLGERFSPGVKHLATVLFMIWRLLWISVTLFASAKMLAVFTGYPLEKLLIVTGVTAIAYSVSGGLRAVVYTDLLQFFVLFGGVAAALLVSAVRGDFSGASLGSWISENRLGSDFFSFNPTIRITFWSGLIGTFVAFFARYGADQITIQRYMAAKTERAAQKSIRLNAGAALLVLTLLLFWGIAISIVSCGNGTAHLPALKQMALFIKSMPAGVTGLIAAGLLAATMSSVDSGLNSMAAVLAAESSLVRGAVRGRVVTLILGITALAGALFVLPGVAEEKTLFVITNQIIHGFGAPILSLVLLGIFSKRSNSQGVFWGTVIGAACSVASVVFLRELAIHYYVVINLICSVAASLLISWAVNLKGVKGSS